MKQQLQFLKALVFTSLFFTAMDGFGQCVDTFPYLEGFETDLGVWFQNTNDDTDWSRHSGRTSSLDTGPSTAHEGGFYAYIEASSNNDKTAILTSSCFDIASLSNPALNFKYHMFGSDMGSLEVEISTDGLSWVSVWSKSGNQGDAWKEASINLSSYAAGRPLLRFKGVVGNGFESDMAIDAVQVREAITETDIVTFVIAEQTGLATIDAANHTVAFEVFGGTVLANLAPAFTLSEGATATVSDIAQISGTTTNDFSNPITYTITAEDGTTMQDWVVTVTEAACLNAFPYFEGFETDLGVWFQNTNDDTDWIRHSGTTSSSDTGPSTAHEGGFYAYIRGASNINKTAVLTSSCFDIASLSNPALNFKYHMYGASMGSLEVEISTDGLSWVSVWSKSGNQGDAWKDASINLSSYAAGSPLLRFKGVVGNGFESDIAIDAVQIREAITETDIVTFVITEQTGPATIDAANHTVAFEVFGGTALANLAPTFTLSEGATATVSDIAQISGTTTNDFSNPITYTITAEDGTTMQDWAVTVTEAACLNAFPYLEGFETDLGVWFQNTNDDTDWIRHSGRTSSSDTGPSTAHEGGFYAYIRGASNSNKTAILTSSCFDIASLSNPALNFKYHMYGASTGSLEVEISTDGLSWVSVWSKSGDQGDDWKEASINLSSYAADSPLLRFKGVVGNGFRSDMAIDAVQIREAITETDIVTFVITEQTGPATIDAANHTVAIEVLGGTVVTNLAPTFTLSEGATATVSDIAQISGTTTNDFSNPITYTITAEDGTTMQDWAVTVTEAACLNAFPYLEGFETDLGVWFQNTNDDTDWIRHSGSTSSSDTGPSTAHEGGFYAYIEASSNNDKTAVLTSSCFDIASLSNPALNFKYHMYGASTGSLEVEISTDGLSWVSVWSKSGDQGNDWKDALINLSSYAAGSPLLRFKGVVGNGFESDMAIDAVQIREVITETDIVTFVITEQTGPATIDAVNHTVAFEVLGGTVVTNLAPTFTLSEGATATVSDIAQISGTTTNDFSNPTTYTITAEDGTTTQDWTITSGTLSTQDIVFSESLLIYPNPAPNKIYISTAHRLDTIKIYGINGKLLKELTPQKLDDKYEITIRSFSPGIYFIEMMSGNKKAVKRFVKK